MRKSISRVVSAVLVLVMMVSVFACYPVMTSAATAYRTAANSVSASYAGSKYYAHYQNVPITGDDITNVLAMAISQWGYQEGNSATSLAGTTKGTGNYSEYNHNMGSIGGYAYYWCATFVAWCLYQGRATDQNTQSAWCRNHLGNATYIWREVGCNYWIRQLKQTGYGYSSLYYGGSYTPVSGDLIFFTNDGGSTSGHIGLVLYCDGATVYTMEGNTGNNTGLSTNGDGVYYKSYALSNSYIFGYGHLPYSKSDSSAKIDYSGSNPTAGLFMNGSSAKTIYAGNNSSGGVVGTIPAFTMFAVTSGNSSELAVSYGGVSGFISNVRSDSTRVIQLSNTSGSSGAGSGGSSGSTTTTSIIGANIDANTVSGIDLAPGSLTVTAGQSVGQRGWIGYNRSIVKFGYAFNYAGDTSTIYYDENFIDTTEAAVLLAGGSNAKRYNIQADTSNLSVGTHKLTFYVVLDDWSIQAINSINVTIQSAPSSGGGSTSTSGPQNTPTSTLINYSFDSFKADDVSISEGATITAGQSIKLTGWVGYSQPVYRFGYAFDFSDIDDIVWTSTTLLATEQAVLDAGGSNAQRFSITADTSALTADTHTLTFYVQFTEWSVAQIYSTTITTTANQSGSGSSSGSTLQLIGSNHESLLVDGNSMDTSSSLIVNYGQTVGLVGWVGYNREIWRIGYAYDYNGDASTIVFPADAILSPDADVVAAGGQYARRYKIQAPTENLSTGKHVLSFYVQFTDGSFGDVGSFYPTINNVATRIDGCVDAHTIDGFDSVGDISVTIGQTVGLRGWVGYNMAITHFGYYFGSDSANTVWTTESNGDDSDAATIQALGGAYAVRYHITAPTSGLTVGSHTITYILKLSDNSTQPIGTLTVSVAAASSGGSTTTPDTPVTPGTPTPTYSFDFSDLSTDPAADFGLSNANNMTHGVNTINGYLNFTATGADPYIGLTTSSAAQMNNMDYVVIKYRTSSTANFQLACGDGWTYMVNSSWNQPYRDYTSEWKLALVDASSVWGNITGQMINFRFDMVSDGASDTTNYNGSSVDVSYIHFFASRADAVSYISTQETTTTSSTESTLTTWPASNVLQTGVNSYTYFQTLSALNNIAYTSAYAGNGDAQHCFDGWFGINNINEPTVVAKDVFLTWDQVELGNVIGGHWDSIAFYGWINPSAWDSGETVVGSEDARNSPIIAVGYQINNDSIVWHDSSTSVDDRSNSGITKAVHYDSSLVAQIGANTRRYLIQIPVAEFDNTKNNHLFLYAKLSDGSVLYLNQGIHLSASPYGADKALGVYVATANGKVNYTYQDGNGTYYSSKPSNAVTAYNGSMYVVSGNSFAVTKNADGTFTTGTAGTTTTIYSVSTPQSAYTITLNANGGSVDPTSLLYSDSKNSAPLPLPYRDGYTFTGWKATTSSGGWTTELLQAGTTVGLGKSGDVTLQAQWTPSSYTITYDPGFGSISNAGTTTYTTGSTIIAATAAAPVGYVFAGWRVTSIGISGDTNWVIDTIYNNGQTISGKYGAATLTAQWTIAPYTITLDANGGSVTSSVLAYNIVNNSSALPTPTRKGYIFTGWQPTSTSGGWTTNDLFQAGDTVGAGKTGNITLQAQWIIDNRLTGATIDLDTALSIRIDATIRDLSSGNWAVLVTMNGRETLIPVDPSYVTGNDSEYSFYFSGIAPQHMGDTLDLALVTYDASTNEVLATHSTKTGYSIRTALVNLKTNNSSNTKLVQLIDDILVYGAAAQKYTKYNVNALVTDGLTLSASSIAPTIADNVMSITTSTGEAKFSTAAVVLDFGYNRLQFRITASTKNVTVMIDGQPADSIVWNEATSTYIVRSETLWISSNDYPHTIELCEDGVVVQTLTYSVNSYAYNLLLNKVDANGNLLTDNVGDELVLALYRYGMSAKAYIS